MNVHSLIFKLRTFSQECIRVLRVTKKPTKLEFKTIVKASALGILIIGMIGFTIQMLRLLLLPPL